MRVAGKTVWSLVNMCHTRAPQRCHYKALYKPMDSLLYFTVMVLSKHSAVHWLTYILQIALHFLVVVKNFQKWLVDVRTVLIATLDRQPHTHTHIQPCYRSLWILPPPVTGHTGKTRRIYGSTVQTCLLSKLTNFSLPHLHLVPPFGVTPFEICRGLWHQKTRDPGLFCGVVCMILHLAISIEHQLVTDGQTHDYGIYCTSMALQGKKTFKQWHTHTIKQKIQRIFSFVML